MNESIQISENRRADFSLPPSFPIRCYRTNLAEQPGGFNPWHWHQELQFLVVAEGAVCVTVEADSYSLDEGEGLFIPPELLHCSRSLSPGQGAYLCFNVSPRLLSCFPGSLIEQNYVFPYLQKGALPAAVLSPSVPWQEEILGHLETLSRCLFQQPPGYALEAVIALLSCWRALLLHLPRGKGSASPSIYNRREIKEIMRFLQTHYQERLTLDQAAAAVSLNKSVCCRLFKQALGCTILEYLTLWRLQRAMELLRNTSASVTQISYDTGFSSTSYFISRFRKLLGCTPLQYRNQAPPFAPPTPSSPPKPRWQ